MSEKQKAAEYGFGAGQEAGYAREIGATDEQIKNYIEFKGQQIPAYFKDAYIAAARRGFTQYQERFSHPIMDAFKSHIRWCIENNAACMRG